MASRPPAEPWHFYLYERHECPLCDELDEQIQPQINRLKRHHRVILTRRFVDDNPEWEGKFGDRVPVLEFKGGTLLEGRPEPEQVAQVFSRLIAQAKSDGHKMI